MPRIFEEFHTVGGAVDRVHIRNEPDWTPDTMINTYFDRCDAATGYRPTPSRPVSDDPRYYNGALYVTPSAARAAEASNRLRYRIADLARLHKQEMAFGIKVGEPGSWFQPNGRIKGGV